MTPDSALEVKAQCRTRTGDPFLTMEVRALHGPTRTRTREHVEQGNSRLSVAAGPALDARPWSCSGTRTRRAASLVRNQPRPISTPLTPGPHGAANGVGIGSPPRFDRTTPQATAGHSDTRQAHGALGVGHTG